ncbi:MULTISPECIES: hypothetical protein [unclassified Pseudomonas]|jgi:hypothetical protein|uniref:hypothetical protein n=1 Tax=unclassified Pseudomonas TaxID=196821 RepID=UPI0011135238|nr:MULTISPECIES: hypothetical protein [unclassified Pseudomonas]
MSLSTEACVIAKKSCSIVGDPGVAHHPLDAFSEVAWKVVIHRENPGVQLLSQGLRTFQTASYRLVTTYVVATCSSVPACKNKIQGSPNPNGTRLAHQGLMCKDVAPDIVR